jgi:hypothetical protein
MRCFIYNVGYFLYLLFYLVRRSLNCSELIFSFIGSEGKARTERH